MHPLSRRIAEVLVLDPAASAIQYQGGWSSWAELAAAADAVTEAVRRHAAGGRIGIMLRNQPAQLAALLGVLMAGATVVVINPSRGDDRTRADVAALELPMLIGLADDLANLGSGSPATTTVTITDLASAPVI